LGIAIRKIISYKILEGDEWKQIAKLKNKTPLLESSLVVVHVSSLAQMMMSAPVFMSTLVSSSTLISTSTTPPKRKSTQRSTQRGAYGQKNKGNTYHVSSKPL
jgi:hypothetical protein